MNWRDRSILWPIVLFICTAAYFTPVELIGLNLYDEGIRLLGGERVLNGEVPYRDFYALYGPGQFYWVALLFKLLGVQVMSLRISFIVFNALGAAALFTWCRRLGVGARGSLLVVLAFVLPRSREFYDGVLDPSVPLILIAGVALTYRPTVGRQFAIGILAGFAALFRHDFGACALIGAAVASVAEQTPWPPVWKLQRTPFRAVAWLLAGFAFTAGMGYGVLAAMDWHALRDNLFTYPATAMQYRTLPPYSGFLPDVRSFQWFAPKPAMIASFRMMVYLAVPASLIVSFGLLKKKNLQTVLGSQRLRAGMAFLICVMSGFTLYGFGRSEWYHLIPVYVVSLPWIAVLVSLLDPGKFWWRVAQQAALVGAISAGVLIFQTKAAEYLRTPYLNLERARGIVAGGETLWITAAVNDLRARPGPILVAAERHDKIFTNAIVLYFLSGRRPGVYFAEFDPGVTTTEPVQQRIVSDLMRNDVRTVFVGLQAMLVEPNRSSVSSGVRILDDYLSENYVEVRRHAEFRILERR